MQTGVCNIAGIGAGALAACAMLPALAEGPATSHLAAGHTPELTRHLRMSEGVTGATVRYYRDIMTGGQHCEKNARGVEDCVFWDGIYSVFEVTFEGVTETDETELKKGALIAIDVACRSAKALVRKPSEVERISPDTFRLGGGCPAVDEQGGN